MTQSEQKKLYEHYILTSKNDANPITKANALGYANEILKSYPQFAVKEEIVEEVVKEIKEAVIKNDEKVHKVLTAKPKEKKK